MPPTLPNAPTGSDDQGPNHIHQFIQELQTQGLMENQKRRFKQELERLIENKEYKLAVKLVWAACAGDTRKVALLPTPQDVELDEYADIVRTLITTCAKPFRWNDQAGEFTTDIDKIPGVDKLSIAWFLVDMAALTKYNIRYINTAQDVADPFKKSWEQPKYKAIQAVRNLLNLAAMYYSSLSEDGDDYATNTDIMGMAVVAADIGVLKYLRMSNDKGEWSSSFSGHFWGGESSTAYAAELYSFTTKVISLLVRIVIRLHNEHAAAHMLDSTNGQIVDLSAEPHQHRFKKMADKFTFTHGDIMLQSMYEALSFAVQYATVYRSQAREVHVEIGDDFSGDSQALHNSLQMIFKFIANFPWQDKISSPYYLLKIKLEQLKLLNFLDHEDFVREKQQLLTRVQRAKTGSSDLSSVVIPSELDDLRPSWEKLKGEIHNLN